MEIDGFENLWNLFITPIENFMDALKGSVKELGGLFKITTANVPTGNLYQQTCNTVKI